ncbi:MAG TPA: hypothetical protein DD381_08200 [Lentisphaeria bacterium]|nr:MAG: hypothetical protein A2X47_04760 [Lentisphaerae bacterium GWF2_38_69]HBM16303.1 hypothetical protein [Lentisphaeria bacterium]
MKKMLTTIILSAICCFNAFAGTVANSKPVWALSKAETPQKAGQVSKKGTALLIIDVQNFCCNKKGILGGNTLQWKYIEDNKVIANIQRAIKKARESNVPVIYIASSLDTRIMPDTDLFKAIKAKMEKLNLSQKELAWNWEVVDGIQPNKNDIIVHKGNWCNAFIDTDLRTITESMGIKRLIITGAVEPACVYATFMGAFDDGIEPIVLSDCTIPAGSDKETQDKIHNFSIDTFYPLMGGEVTTSEFLRFME